MEEARNSGLLPYERLCGNVRNPRTNAIENRSLRQQRRESEQLGQTGRRERRDDGLDDVADHEAHRRNRHGRERNMHDHRLNRDAEQVQHHQVAGQ